jgi:uncharacterized protein
VELYLDTSALVKLYLAEPDHDAVVSAIREALGVTTSVVAYAEARAAFARRLRETTLTSDEYAEVVAAFNAGWRDLDRIPVSDEVAYSAGELAERYALRGFDAIHLASARWLQDDVDNLHFMAFDERLTQAARLVMPVYDIE